MNTKHHSPPRLGLRVAAAFSLVCAALISCGALAAESVKTFDIPAQPLAQALADFSRQSNVIIVAPSGLTSGKTSKAVAGSMSPSRALDRLLEGSALRYVMEADGSVVLRAEKNRPERSSDAGRINVARQDATAGQEPSAAGDEVEEMLVEGARERAKPFTDANVDIPRTINDVQPYYIFDAKTIERSGAANIEDFLKQRLTMNTVAQTNREKSVKYETVNTAYMGNTSTINLRGLGADKTLVLINGRRMPGVQYGSTENQPDLNGIPLSAIDRIEVLPSSASGIYGGSAIGGVVNVILRKDYVGGEAQAIYDNTWDIKSPRRTVSLSYGLALQKINTHLDINASWSDAKPMLLRDRIGIFRRNTAILQSNLPEFSPTFPFSGLYPRLGNVPNIASWSEPLQVIDGEYVGANLVLKGGTPLNSPFTHISSGISNLSSANEVRESLLQNAGQWNAVLPLTAQEPDGLLRSFGASPETRSLRISLRRQLSPRLEIFTDLSYQKNDSVLIYHPLDQVLYVPATAPTNPFEMDVGVRFPDAMQASLITDSTTRNVTLGAIARLSPGWTGMGDYTYSENRFGYSAARIRLDPLQAALESGALNPFVDTLLYPLDLQQYLLPRAASASRRSSEAQALSVRASGPLPALPWSAPSSLTIGVQHEMWRMPEEVRQVEFPLFPDLSFLERNYERETAKSSVYAEMTIPLVKSARLPFMHAMEMQLSGRTERYTVDTGTTSEEIHYNRTPPTTTYRGTTLDGLPYFSEASYTPHNYTLGLRYQPISGWTLRTSRSTAFLPPAPFELMRNPFPDLERPVIEDPVTGSRYPVQTISGGNPDLRPQNSLTANMGIIWEPGFKPLEGLRISVDYSRTEQFDAIGSLSPQMIVSQEDSYPGRVTRNGSGTIVLVDASYVNLFHRENEQWDVTVDYSIDTGLGQFSFTAMESIILHLKNQYSQTRPEYDAVNFPSEQGAVKYKSNASLSWASRGWSAGWSTRYIGSYKIAGATGGPASMQLNGGTAPANMTSILAQGGDTVPWQMYHDLFLGYTFARSKFPANAPGISASILAGVTLQLGVRNVFDKVPPLDVNYSPYYLSPFEGMQLRSFWVNAKKAF